MQEIMTYKHQHINIFQQHAPYQHHLL